MTAGRFEDRALYELLPIHVRQRDEELGGPLLQAFEVLGREADRLEVEIAAGYANSYVETCAPWALPYIGDLIGYRPIATLDDPEPGIPAIERRRRPTLRRDIGRTIWARRRKGTARVLAAVVEAIAGWHSVVFENGRNIVSTPPLRFPGVLVAQGTPDLRKLVGPEHTNQGPTLIPRVAEVRRVDRTGGPARWYPLDVVLEAWPQRAYLMHQTRAVQKSDYLTFNPLGLDIQLFAPAVETAAPTPVLGSARAMRRSDFWGKVGKQQSRRVYGDKAAVCLWIGEEKLKIEVTQVHFGPVPDADREERFWTIDPEQGRIQPPADFKGKTVYARYFYGFGDDIGGGAYRRLPATSGASLEVRPVGRDRPLVDQIADFLPRVPAGKELVVEIRDSDTYQWGGSRSGVDPTARLVPVTIRSKSGCMPILRAESDDPPDGSAELGRLNVAALGGVSSVSFEGMMLVCRQMHAGAGLGELTLRDITLVDDGSQSVSPAPLAFETRDEARPITIRIERSIIGGIRAEMLEGSLQTADAGPPDIVTQVIVRDSVVQASEEDFSGPIDLTIACCTVDRQKGVGRAPGVFRIHSTDSIVPWGSLPSSPAVTGREFVTSTYSWGPEPELRPRFLSTEIGKPGYYQLAEDNSQTVLRGAADGGALGALRRSSWSLLSDVVRVRLKEFVPLESRARVVFRV
jgi:hypothetical protein